MQILEQTHKKNFHELTYLLRNGILISLDTQTRSPTWGHPPLAQSRVRDWIKKSVSETEDGGEYIRYFTISRPIST